MRAFLVLLLAAAAAAGDPPLRVCCTVPDLGDLVRAVGGADAEVAVFARGGDDPHWVEPRPSFAKALAAADLVVSVGMELEIGWLPVVVQQSRNPRLRAGLPGWLEAASAIRPLGVPERPVDRSAGDVHAGGNPHFLTDPVRGVQVARAIAVRLGELRPAIAAPCLERWRGFAVGIARRLAGDAAVDRIGAEAAAAALAAGDAAALAGADPGGWLGRLRPAAGAAVIADHDLWPYLAERFGLRVIALLEPKPGIPPSTAHLAAVVERARTGGARAILTVPYFDPRHARRVADATGLPVAALAHQVGALPAAADWTAMIDANVAALAAALIR